MIRTSTQIEHEPAARSSSGPPPLGAVTAAALGMASAWTASGSIGLVAGEFRLAVAWTLLAAAAVLVRPSGRRLAWLAVAAAMAVGLPSIAPGQDVAEVMVVAIVLVVLARAASGLGARVLGLAAVAVIALGIWRLAVASLPTAWMVSTAVGMGLGRLTGWVSGRPLRIGAGFGGLDFLVPMAVLWFGWLRGTARPRTGRALWAAAAILAAHLLYLVLLSWSNDLAAMLPDPPPAPSLDAADYRPPEWLVSDTIRAALPWNLPLAAMLAHGLVLGLMFRWAAWEPTETAAARSPAAVGRSASNHRRAVLASTVLMAAVVMLGGLSWGSSSLAGKRIVVYQHGDLNWSKPGHEDFSIASAGLFGMLPAFVSSLGGELVLSPTLAEADLAEADVLLLLHPTDPWTPQQSDQITQFVEGGGSLLVVAGPASPGPNPRGAVNQLLEPAGMVIQDNVAVPAAEDWQDGLLALAHPATRGLQGRYEPFGMRLSSSLGLRWPARPILVGTWGHGEPGSDAATTGAWRYEPGEKLGDLVLMAERPRGRGTVVALACEECLTNLTSVYSYPFTGRLLAYLAHRSSNPQDWWRQVAGWFGCLGLLAILLWRRQPASAGTRPFEPGAVLAMALTAAVLLPAVHLWNARASEVLPKGSPRAETPVAYLDASHLEGFSGRAWSNEGIEGLSMTLMRNGYLPLVLHDRFEERLEDAAAVFAIAPGRAFSSSQRQAVRRFVEGGGLFVLMVGSTESGPHEALLGEFSFRVPPVPQPPEDRRAEPVPSGQFPDRFGRFRTAYVNAADYGVGDYFAYVYVFHGWPVECRAEDAEVLVRGHGSQSLAVARPVGAGWLVAVGDGAFALNFNMGYHDGREVQGVVENAQFWRWLFARLVRGEDWIPPSPATETTGQEATSQEATP